MESKWFNIKEVERFSEIKAHTLRIWEHRYALTQPERTPGNFRLYSLDQLKIILNIALLKKNGFRILRLSKFQSREIEDKVALLSNDYSKWQRAINELIVNMYTPEPESFEEVLNYLFNIWPEEILIEKIIYPFLKKTGLLWTGHKLYEEHLVVTAIRNKIILAIENKKSIKYGHKKVLLFLPGTKQLDIGLLYSQYFLKSRGVHVIYMGNDITIQNLKTTFLAHPPNYLFTYHHPKNPLPVEELMEFINLNANYVKLIIGQYPLEDIGPTYKGNLIQMNYADALEFLHLNGK